MFKTYTPDDTRSAVSSQAARSTDNRCATASATTRMCILAWHCRRLAKLSGPRYGPTYDTFLDFVSIRFHEEHLQKNGYFGNLIVITMVFGLRVWLAELFYDTHVLLAWRGLVKTQDTSEGIADMAIGRLECFIYGQLSRLKKCS